MIPHEEFVDDVIQKTKPLSVPEECMKEGYEYDKDKRGPRSRPEYERRKSNHSPISSGEELSTNAGQSDTDKLSPGDVQIKDVNCEGEVKKC